MKIKKVFANLEEYLCAFLLATMTIIVAIQVFSRFVLNNSLSWSEELAIYILAWVTFLGASIGVKRGAHIGVEAFILMLPKRAQKYVVSLAYLVSAIFFSVLIVVGFRIILTQMSTGQVSPAMRIPMYYAYLSVPVGSIFITIRFVEKFIGEMKKSNKQAHEIMHTGGNSI